MKELRCESRMASVRCGLSSVVPLHVLTVMTPLDMEIRTCGLPCLDLGFLKVCYMRDQRYFLRKSWSRRTLVQFHVLVCNFDQ